MYKSEKEREHGGLNGNREGENVRCEGEAKLDEISVA